MAVTDQGIVAEVKALDLGQCGDRVEEGGGQGGDVAAMQGELSQLREVGKGEIWMKGEGRAAKLQNLQNSVLKLWQKNNTCRSEFAVNKLSPSSRRSSTSQPSIEKVVNCFRLTKSSLERKVSL